MATTPAGGAAATNLVRNAASQHPATAGGTAAAVTVVDWPAQTLWPLRTVITAAAGAYPKASQIERRFELWIKLTGFSGVYSSVLICARFVPGSVHGQLCDAFPLFIGGAVGPGEALRALVEEMCAGVL